MDEEKQVDWLMVIEDQDDVWRVLNGALKRRLPNVLMRHAVNGPTALSFLQACSLEHRLLPRIILMDLYMPKLQDGLTLLDTLNDPASRLSHVPVVVMSSSANPLDQQQAIQRNACFLSKPLLLTDWDAFLDTIHQYWIKSASAGES